MEILIGLGLLLILLIFLSSWQGIIPLALIITVIWLFTL